MWKNRKILVSFIVFLLVTNLFTIGTIVYHRTRFPPPNFEEIRDNGNRKSFSPESFMHFFAKEMKLDSVQKQHFMAFHATFRKEADSLIVEMDTRRELYKNLMFADTVDIVRMENLSQEIGALHARMKTITLILYLEMRAELQKEQIPVLNRVIGRITGKPNHEECRPKGDWKKWRH